MGDAGPIEADLPSVREEVPVLIIGGGPAGLLEAFILTQLGVKSLIVEKYEKRLTAPKAHAIGPRSFDILRQSGINIRKLRESGTSRDDSRRVCLVTTMAGEELRSYPYERMDADVLDSTPEMFHNVTQPVTEEHIADRLKGHVEIRKGHSFVSCRNNDDGVKTVIENRSTGELYAIQSKYLVACDGAKSKVRENVGIQCLGESAVQTLMTIELTVDVRPVVKDRRRMLYNFLNPELTGVMIAYDLGSKMVLVTSVQPQETPLEKWDKAHCEKLIDAAIGQKIPYTIDSFRPWALRRNVAEKYRCGNVFLAGDSAHSFPPSAGIGLNTGFGDVHNLAYKIAAVCNGWATPEILNTYEQERRPVADINSAQSVRNSRRIHTMYQRLGLTDANSEKAREKFREALGDPSKQAGLKQIMDELNTNFDNLELHIGFVYGNKTPPDRASDYQPKYVPGARLPHLWIRPLNADLMRGIPPTDLSHVHELSVEDQSLRQFSTLDLCRLDQFTLIVNSTPGQTERAKEIENLVKSSKVSTPPRLRIVTLGEDFEIIFKEKAEEWLDRFQLGSGQFGGVLLRPDQHILFLLTSQTTAQEAANAVREHIGVGKDT